VKNILIIALLVFTAGNALSAVSTTLTILIMGRCIAGMGAGIFSPLAIAGAAALVSPSQKGTALGVTLGSMSMGVVLGVPFGLLIAERGGWQSTLWLITVIGIIGMVVIQLKFPSVKASTPPTLIQRLSILKNKKVATTITITFLTALSSLVSSDN